MAKAGTTQRARMLARQAIAPKIHTLDVTEQPLRRGDLAGIVKGTQFDWQSADFIDPETNELFDGGDREARDMRAALAADHKLRQLSEILTSAIKGATWKLLPDEGDTGEAKDTEERLRRKQAAGGMTTPIRLVIAQAASSIYYKRAYFAVGWKLDTKTNDGAVLYSQLAMRPASTCRLLRNPDDGSFEGFAQDIVWYGNSNRKWDGKPIHFTRKQAVVFINGLERDPVSGVSDLEVALWCWRTKRKTLMLWLSFLQAQALPRTILKHKGDEERARAAARIIAALGSSGVGYVDASQIELDTLDVSGAGPGAFKEMVMYLDTCASGSVLAGFTDLTSQATNSARGSNALSTSATDTFNETREHAARGLEDVMTNDVVAPMVRHNHGNDAAFPDWKFDPLAGTDESKIVSLLQALATAQSSVIPVEFINELALSAARLLNLDVDKIKGALLTSSQLAAKQAAAANANAVGQQAAAVNGAVNKVKQIAAVKAAAP